MKRISFLILLAGVIGAIAGAVLILVSPQVEGMFWLAVPITILGLVLLAIWAYSGFRRRPPEIPPASQEGDETAG